VVPRDNSPTAPEGSSGDSPPPAAATTPTACAPARRSPSPTSAGGPAVLHLHITRSTEVQQLERIGSHAQVAWRIEDGPLTGSVVRGWVDARRLVPLATLSGRSLDSIGGLGLSGASNWGGGGGEHPLHVDVGHGPELIGTILVGTRVCKGPRRGALVVVSNDGRASRTIPVPLKLRPGATLLLAPADADECAR
jgi:hypothetical protein